MKRLRKRPGPKSGYAVRVLVARFGVSERRIRMVGAKTLVKCPNNEAIRLLLGVKP